MIVVKVAFLAWLTVWMLSTSEVEKPRKQMVRDLLCLWDTYIGIDGDGSWI